MRRTRLLISRVGDNASEERALGRPPQLVRGRVQHKEAEEKQAAAQRAHRVPKERGGDRAAAEEQHSIAAQQQPLQVQRRIVASEGPCSEDRGPDSHGCQQRGEPSELIRCRSLESHVVDLCAAVEHRDAHPLHRARGGDQQRLLVASEPPQPAEDLAETRPRHLYQVGCKRGGGGHDDVCEGRTAQDATHCHDATSDLGRFGRYRRYMRVGCHELRHRGVLRSHDAHLVAVECEWCASCAARRHEEHERMAKNVACNEARRSRLTWRSLGRCWCEWSCAGQRAESVR